MTETSFFPRGAGLTIAELAELCEGEIGGPVGEHRLNGVATLAGATSFDVSFFDNPRYAGEVADSRAGCVVVAARLRKHVPDTVRVLVSADPQRAFALVGRALYPDALSPSSFGMTHAISDRADIDPTARLEDGVVVEAFAVVGPGAEIGRGTILSSGSIVGPNCRIGRDCRVGQQVTVQHALIGNNVILHPGVKIGQDGFGYSMGAKGILKMVQIGRVIIQDDVEIGANTTIDRGALRDTVIGENTKIDNHVQIAHNVTIGRNCVIVSQVGISGSATIGNGVVIAGQSGVIGHVTIGDGAQIAAVSSVAGDVPAGARWGGTPAHDLRDWFREVTWVRESAKTARRKAKKDDE